MAIRTPALQTRGANAVPNTAKRALLYLRVSTPSQVNTDYDPEGISIPAQRAKCEQKAAQMGGVGIIDTYVEPGRSATSMDRRPALQEMLTRIRKDRDVDYVIVYHFSRIFRNSIEAAIIKNELGKLGVRVVSTILDMGEGPESMMVETIIHAVDQYQSQASGADIAYKMSEKARHGGTVGRAPIGYVNARDNFEGREIRTVQVDSERAPLVHKAFELYATNDYTIDALHDELEHLGLRTRPGRFPSKPLSKTQLQFTLTNRYYLGYVTYKGEEIQGRHDAIIEPALFDQVQGIMATRGINQVRKRTHDHYLKGLIWCYACNRQGHEFRLIRQQSTGNGGVYEYYFCRGRQEHICPVSHVWVDEIEDAVIDFYARLDPSPEFVTLIRERVTEVVQDEEFSSRLRHKQIQQDLVRLGKQEDNLLDLAAEGQLSSVKVHERLRKIVTERDALSQELGRLELGLAAGAAFIEDAVKLLENAARLYELASDQQRQLLNRALFEKLYVRDNDVVSAVFKEPFDELISAADAMAEIRAVPSWAADGFSICENKKDRLATALFSGDGSSKSVMVELTGLEPATSWLQTRRSTN
jgi:site-specific DNA recombinase